MALDLGDDSPVADVIASPSARLLLTGALFAAWIPIVALSPLGRLSGAHLNPAVTLAFRVLGRVSNIDVAGYLAAQATGALVGALAFRALWGGQAVSVGGGVTHSTVAVPVALALEAGMTAALMAAILAFNSGERSMRWTPFAVWPLIAILTWRLGTYTGTSLNPARSEGPALAFGDLAGLWLYLAAPTAGAVAVALLWRKAAGRHQPVTAKLFHDPRYPSSLGCEVPAAGL